MPLPVLTLKDIQIHEIESLLRQYQLTIKRVKDDSPIPGSFWGDAEAGLINHNVYVRDDTPVHSVLHETCHYICMDSQRRSQLDTNAGGDYAEENAVCYLQILLANALSEVGSERMMQDMDNWGYTFRLGSAKNWFTSDADDAKQWLIDHGIIDNTCQPTLKLRC